MEGVNSISDDFEWLIVNDALWGGFILYIDNLPKL